eukprot:TRINITY_DN4774_c0_g1_i1.p3 TRINITY_DN4774_c0_g1~~TRINITY_DN4774_c0_g1_i1.p3  ORF type:complete len:105 (-),score=15.19 TRINITY_DN4774_c0_g1_i1:592-906(-)
MLPAAFTIEGLPHVSLLFYCGNDWLAALSIYASRCPGMLDLSCTFEGVTWNCLLLSCRNRRIGFCSLLCELAGLSTYASRNARMLDALPTLCPERLCQQECSNA